jgi:hypothetical protein
MSSLHDNFYSDLNKKFMFELCKRTFSEEGKDISDQYELFTTVMKKTFENTKASTIEDMNRELVQTMIQELNNQVTINENKDVSMETNMQPQTKVEVIRDYKDIIQPREETPLLRIQNRLAPEVSTNRILFISSSVRNDFSSNRYCFKVFQVKPTQFKQLIIPHESGYLFTSPIIKVTIPELNVEMFAKCTTTQLIHNYTYGYYDFFDHSIQSPDTLTEFTIQYSPIYGSISYESDFIDIESIDKKIIILSKTPKQSQIRTKDCIRLYSKESNDTMECKVVFIDREKKSLKVDKVIKNHFSYCMNLCLQNTIIL